MCTKWKFKEKNLEEKITCFYTDTYCHQNSLIIRIQKSLSWLQWEALLSRSPCWSRVGYRDGICTCWQLAVSDHLEGGWWHSGQAGTSLRSLEGQGYSSRSRGGLDALAVSCALEQTRTNFWIWTVYLAPYLLGHNDIHDFRFFINYGFMRF